MSEQQTEDAAPPRQVSFVHSEDGTVYAEGRSFRDYRCFTRHYRGLPVVLTPEVRTSARGARRLVAPARDGV